MTRAPGAAECFFTEERSSHAEALTSTTNPPGVAPVRPQGCELSRALGMRKKKKDLEASRQSFVTYMWGRL